jgi:cell division protein FtsI (penicillin-binding protein 3)
VIANRGRKLDLSLIKQNPEDMRDNEISRHVMKASTAKMLLTMLEQVVGPGGTAQRAAIDGYRIAGKTGTVKKNVDGGYQKDVYMAIFAGIAPVSNPRLVMAVVIDEPTQNGYYGGQVAAPVFHEVMSNALRILDIAPDNLPTLQARSTGLDAGA